MTQRPQSDVAHQPAGAPEHASVRGRRIVALLLVAALLLTAVLRFGVHTLHDNLAYSDRPRPQSRLQGLNTFALGLVLGGLRGPLVMFLWTSSETQKTQRNLEDFDTKIELIRMLQPEFDSVHIFQSWNKGYNVSVQMATLPNKYATILDAIRYLEEVDEQRPDNVNILVSTADLYFNKLGNSAEKRYYLQRLREDSMWREEKASRLAGQRQMRHRVLLGPEGKLLPQYLAARSGVGGKTTAAGETYTGAELQFLEKWNERGGFPYGVSPLALGYNYYKRAAVLQQTTGRRHLYMTEPVVDSRPPIILKLWSDEEWDRSRRAEARLVGKATPDDKFQLEPVTASLKPSDLPAPSEQSRQMLNQSLFEIQRAAQLAVESEAGHERHMKFSESLNTDYRSHAQEAALQAKYLTADYEYLSAVAKLAGYTDLPALAEGDARALLQSARQKYAETMTGFYLHTLKYYVQDEVASKAYPMVDGELLRKPTIHRADPSQYKSIFEATRKVLEESGEPDAHADDAMEYSTYAQRAEIRINTIDQILPSL